MKKIKINPSFLLVVIISVFTRNLILLTNYLLALFLHELAHLFVSTQKGYTLKVIRLSVFGLSLELNEKINDRDQFAINIAGPCFNLFICLVCLATYWIFPNSYQYLNVFCLVNLTLALFNLLPIYPLDGGKIFHGIIKSERMFKTLNIILKWGGGLMFVLMFMGSMSTKPNFMFLILSVFFLTLSGKRIPTTSIFKCSKHKNFDKVVILKVDDSTILLELIKHIRTSCFTIFYIEKDKKFIDENEIVDFAIKHSLTTKLSDVK